mmetsp:Transcript_7372/g.8466  ORF Transcript_7372/g.8466 Transcript_7372/m.8466 type:complete len:84 (+) Transcript_7372:512-763(+)
MPVCTILNTESISIISGKTETSLSLRSRTALVGETVAPPLSTSAASSAAVRVPLEAKVALVLEPILGLPCVNFYTSRRVYVLT